MSNNINGYTPLFLAVERDYIDIVKKLLNADGIDPNILNEKTEIAPIHLAIDSRHQDILKELLKHANVDVNLPDLRKSKETPLINAVRDGNTDPVKELLKRDDIDVEKKDAKGERPLRYAAYRQNMEILKALLEKGADVNGRSANGFTALHEASSNGALAVVKELLKRNADVNLTLSQDNITPLFIATMGSTNRRFEDRYGDEDRYSDIIKELLDAGANPNVESPEGITPLYLVSKSGRLNSVKYLLQKGANVNIAAKFGAIKRNTALYVACERGFLEIVNEILSVPKGPAAIDKTSEGAKKVLEAAKDGKFSAEIQKPILDFFKEKSRGDELWKGWTRSDAATMDAIFGTIEEMKGHEGDEEFSFVPLDDITYCPICLAFSPRMPKKKDRNTPENQSKGCMYVYHNCRKTAGAILHEGLYNKYKSSDQIIYWCTICNRIALDHQHYALGPPSVDGPLPPLLSTGNPYGKTCKPNGGGVEEKIRRLMRLREVAKELTETAGEITNQEAVNRLVEEMWAAGQGEDDVDAVLAAKEFPIKAANFPANRANANAPNRNYPNVTRSAANLETLKPEISKDVPKWDPIALDTLAPAVLFNHRRPDGKVVHHKRGKEDGEDGEWLSFKTIKERIEEYVKNYGAEGFGMCPTECGARLYPDEVKDIVSEDLYEKYRKAFNKYPWPKEGGRRRQTRRQAKKQSGGTKPYEGIFHPLTDISCVKPWKVGRNTKKAAR
jgi:ankyrin repeat protein